MLQAEKLSQAQLFELFRTIVFWTLGIPIPSATGHLAIFLPNSRHVSSVCPLIVPGYYIDNLPTQKVQFGEASWMCFNDRLAMGWKASWC